MLNSDGVDVHSLLCCSAGFSSFRPPEDFHCDILDLHNTAENQRIDYQNSVKRLGYEHPKTKEMYNAANESKHAAQQASQEHQAKYGEEIKNPHEKPFEPFR